VNATDFALAETADRTGGLAIMHEPVVHWSAVTLFLTVLFGWAAVHLLLDHKNRRRRRRHSRGFRSMKSNARAHRSHTKRSHWQQPAHADPRTASGRRPGWG
jgi:hypothetical protein